MFAVTQSLTDHVSHNSVIKYFYAMIGFSCYSTIEPEPVRTGAAPGRICLRVGVESVRSQRC